MSGSSLIEWTDATWNPVRGCSRVSEGCRNCYAERHAARFVKAIQLKDVDEAELDETVVRNLPFRGFAERTAAGPRWTGKVQIVPSALDWPLRWRGAKAAREAGRPSRIFVNSMSDLFHERLSDGAIDRVFGVMARSPRHTFQVLTKRPDRMLAYTAAMAALGPQQRALRIARAEYEDHPARGMALRNLRAQNCGPLAWPLPNVWKGVSVENQATADERIPLLLKTPAAKRFVSYEPALGPLDFGAVPVTAAPGYFGSPFGWHHQGKAHVDDGIPYPTLDWIIVGGESGPGARPFDVAWARSTVKQCREAGVAVFVKQLGATPLEICPLCEGEVGRVQGGWVDSCGKVHDEIIQWSQSVRDRKGGDWSEWPEELRVREFPG